jgi:hypothetical protein
MLDYRAESLLEGVQPLSRTQLLERIGVRPPYLALGEMALEGRFFTASARAEAPSFAEQGPMTAAELGRHAALAGLCHAALSQRDDKRRYYLARQAHCHYTANAAPYGSRVGLRSEIAVEKRQARADITVTAAQRPLAEFTVNYTILTEPAFARLFSRHRQPTFPTTHNPYKHLLAEAFQRGEDWLEQRFTVPASACAGHFEDYPALPVAVLMGQLSYLAGQLAGKPFRVSRGEVEASDLCWAGEEARFSVQRAATEGSEQRFECSAHAEDRQTGHMSLWLDF